MSCVVCGYKDSRQKVHAHLAEAHRFFCAVSCPVCGWRFRKEVNPRGRDPEFLKTYEREVRLVSTDLLLYHLAGEHEQEFLGAKPSHAEENVNGAGQ